ncbi:MAG: phenylalanine--tRNA ligase subunit beta, partial [Acidimicrobiia bacterium]|nr:phenylalanine--tRNA ligase subunit beta [Acidimicrobiia bacterium]
MKVSLRWLDEFVELPTEDPEELASVLSSLGHEVEGYEVLTPTFEGILVGRVETVAPHPDADKVRLCTVDTGSGPAEIICGAWNFEAGAIVPVAVPGATLDGGAFEITQRKIRGIVSNGMICSARELGLGEDHEGIMVLDPDLPVGSDFGDHVELPDVVFDLTITPNRPDAMSMLGIARDFGAYYEVPVRMPDVSDPGGTGTETISVTIEDARCPRFTAREVAGVTIGQAPLWMQDRLRKAGVRSISNVVDVSNYVMLELGQPTHAFDLDRVRDEAIVVRAPHVGEHLTTLDGVERTLLPEHLVVADAEMASSLAGTMGGEESEVSDTTTRVLVEVASWDPPTVMKMSRSLNLHSEASGRFERGVDSELPPLANHRMCRLLAEYAGGTAVGELVDAHPAPAPPTVIELSVRDVTRTLGDHFEDGEIASLLGRLHFEVAGTDPMVVRVPTFRPDVTRPVDLVEEVLRLKGFDGIPASLPDGAGGGLTREQHRVRLLRQVLNGAGLDEAQTFSFHGADELARMGLPESDPRRDAIRVRNPLREEESLLRTTLLPGLLESARYNLSHGVPGAALFEIGRVFFDEEAPEYGVVPHQPVHLAFVIVGEPQLPGVFEDGDPVDVFTSTALVRHIAAHLGFDEVRFAASDRPPLHPVRGAEVTVEGDIIGHVGELHPRVARAWELPGRVAVGEVEVAPLAADRPLWRFVEPSAFPPADFDLAFVAADEVSADTLLDALRSAVGDLGESMDVFDEYRGASVGEGRRSLAVRVRLRAHDRTLTSEEAGAVREAAIAAVERLGAE